MRKSIYEPRYRLMARMMREAREEANITQAELAEMLGRTSEQVSKWERCQRRLDLRDLDDYLAAIGADIVVFVDRWKRLAVDIGEETEVKLPVKQRRAKPKLRAGN
jgi:transcriptional regulator with XRE-family HTH domain